MENHITPFENIGLCFSGGGYRATFFALGILSYLDRIVYKDKPLLESVKALSTVSGGTLTGVAYAKAVQDPDYDFKVFFKTFYNTFTPEHDKLLETAIGKLEDDAVWNKNLYKKRSLINAFALTYSEMPVFAGQFEKFDKNKIKQLEQVCFNGTDFSFGLTFRFQNRGFFGNNPLYKHNRKEINAITDSIELGDIIASSSCFPIGFAPLIFPDDYVKDHESVAYKNVKGIHLFSDGVGIMDGGIADNQGIDSMLNISNRMDNGLDLIMINDVGSYKMEPWQPDNSETKKSPTLKRTINRFLKYFTIKPLYWITLLIGLLLVLGNSYLEVDGKPWTGLYIVGSIILGIGITLTLLGIVASFIKGNILNHLRKLFNKNVPEPLVDDILSFQKLDINLVQRMVTERLTSGSKMINDVFLKQIRRLNYELFYSNENLDNRRLTSTVYKLNGQPTPYSDGPPKYSKEITPKPSSILKSVCLTASETPTTLWWDKEDIAKNRMDTLIACGQFTVCYELMDYINTLKKADPPVVDDFSDIDALYKALEKDWKAFNTNPLFMVKPV